MAAGVGPHSRGPRLLRVDRARREVGEDRARVERVKPAFPRRPVQIDVGDEDAVQAVLEVEPRITALPARAAHERGAPLRVEPLAPEPEPVDASVFGAADALDELAGGDGGSLDLIG